MESGDSGFQQDALAEGRIKPRIDRVLALSRWREGFDAMANREVVGKVVFVPGG